jgi:hypothetical protein
LSKKKDVECKISFCQKRRKHFLLREKNVSGFVAIKKILCREVQSFINSSINNPIQDKNIQKLFLILSYPKKRKTTKAKKREELLQTKRERVCELEACICVSNFCVEQKEKDRTLMLKLLCWTERKR